MTTTCLFEGVSPQSSGSSSPAQRLYFNSNSCKPLTANSSSYFDSRSRFLPSLELLLSSLLSLGTTVVLGVFTQPYCHVEENHDAIEFYHRLLNDSKHGAAVQEKRILVRPALLSNALTLFQYYQLADYGHRLKRKETLVWLLPSVPHSQDEALVRELARYAPSPLPQSSSLTRAGILAQESLSESPPIPSFLANGSRSTAQLPLMALLPRSTGKVCNFKSRRRSR